MGKCFISVTARKNQPSSYRFTQANQRNPWTILDWTSQIPLTVAFSSENNLDVINLQFFIKYKLEPWASKRLGVNAMDRTVL